MLAKRLKALMLKVDNCNTGVTGHIQYSVVGIASGVNDHMTRLSDIRKHLNCEYVEHMQVKTANGDHFDLWLNETGKLENMRPCVPLVFGDQVYDVIAGNTLVTRYNQEGDIIALTDEDINAFLDHLKNCWKIACEPHKSMLNLEQAA